MRHTLKIAGLVLAGGQGSRMHYADKAFMELDNRPCIDWVITRLKEQCSAIAISANGNGQRFATWDYPVLADTYHNVGPLAGLLSGLEWAEAAGFDMLLSVPVDTPCIPPDLAQALLPAPSYATYARQEHALVALWPVCTARALLAAQLAGITEQNRRQNTRVCTLAQALGAHPVDFALSSPFDPFMNINTPEDLLAVQAFWSTRGGVTRMESDQPLLPISTTSQVVRAIWLIPSDTSPTLSEETLRLAEEVPLALMYNGLEYAVMMVTPCDIADFVTGFSITESIVQSGSDIRQVSVTSVDGGLQADIRVSADALRTVLGRSRRPIAGRTGCGICGSDMQSVLRRASNTVQPYQPEFSAIRFALTNLRRHQVLNTGIGMLHAAAWCGTDGQITALREDVGRHNALDKLIGYGAKNEVDFANGFGLLTSRCSYEMATKAIVAGMRALVSLSAPTALALRTAQQAGLTLISPAKPENICVLPTLFEKP